MGVGRDALDTLGLPQTGTRAIYLVNDSVYGPFADLQPLLDAVDFEGADIWGATESWQHRYRDRFLLCGESPPSAVRLGSGGPWGACKDWIIRHCEIGTTGAMMRVGLRCAPYFPSATLLDQPGDGEAAAGRRGESPRARPGCAASVPGPAGEP